MPNPYQFCIVCGRGSQRSSWPNTKSVNGINYVACDFHSVSAMEISTIDTGGAGATYPGVGTSSVTVFPAQNGKIRKTVHESSGE